MKKVISFFMAIISVFVCAFIFVTCGADNRGEKNKNVVSLALVFDNGAEYHSILYYMGDTVYGELPDLDSFKLYAEYSDGTRTELDKADSRVSVRYNYNLEDVSALPDFYDLGTYMVIYSYEYREVGVMFKVVTSATVTPYEISVDKTTWQHREEPIVTVSRDGENLPAYAYRLYCITEEKFDRIKNSENFTFDLRKNSEKYSSDKTQPGSYYLFAYVKGLERFNSTFTKVTIE